MSLEVGVHSRRRLRVRRRSRACRRSRPDRGIAIGTRRPADRGGHTPIEPIRFERSSWKARCPRATRGIGIGAPEFASPPHTTRHAGSHRAGRKVDIAQQGCLNPWLRRGSSGARCGWTGQVCATSAEHCRLPGSRPLPDDEGEAIQCGELLVRIQAIPFNLNGLERVNGGNMTIRPEFPYAPGAKVLGEVVATDGGLEGWVGRRVAATTKGAHGGFAEPTACAAASAFDVPTPTPLRDATAIHFSFHLAWLGLLTRAELQAGESVLIHAAADGSGTAAIQLAKARGARALATAGSKKSSRCVANWARTSPSTTKKTTLPRSCSPRRALLCAASIIDEQV